MVKVLVLGGAGFLGVNVVDALLAAGLQPVVGHRKRTNTLLVRRRKVPRVLADLDQSASLVEAMQDCDVVVHAAAHYPRFSDDLEAALATGVPQCRHVLDAAAAAGVQRLIYLSSTATAAPAASGPSDERHVFANAPDLGVYHHLKWSMEQPFLAEDRLDVRVLCPGACIGPFDLRVGTSALLVATARGMMPPHPDGWVNIVDARDVGRAVVHVASSSGASRRLLLSGTSQRIQSLLESLSERYGVSPPATPLQAADATALADRAEAKARAEGGRAELSREIVDLLVHGVPINAQRAETELELQWTPLDQTLDAFDDFARRMRFIPHAPDQESRCTPPQTSSSESRPWSPSAPPSPPQRSS